MMFLKNFGISNRVNITMRTNNEKCCQELTSKTINSSTFDDLKITIDSHLNSIKDINDKRNFLEEAFSAIDVVAPFGKQPDNIKLTLKYIKSLIAKSVNTSSEYFNKQNQIFKKINQQKEVNKLAISITNGEGDSVIANKIQELANFIENYTVNSRQNQLVAQERKMRSNIETIHNNGDAGSGYINSCGAIAVYDAFKQNENNAHIISSCNLNRNEFARDFKDDLYQKAKNIVEFCDNIERLDENIKNEVSIRLSMQYKSILNEIDYSKKLTPEEIKMFAEKDMECDAKSNKAICDYYGNKKVFDALQDLLKDIYGDYFVNYIKKCLQDKKESKKQHIIDIKKELENNLKIETCNKKSISLYQTKQSLREFTQLIKKLSNPSSFPELQFEEWYLIYKSLDCCFSPRDIYDIIKMYDKEEVIKKKKLFDNFYKSQQLSIAQIGIGLAKYGYIFDNIVKTTRNFQEIEIVSYKHVLNASILEIVHFPGHWEALKIPKIS